MQEFNSIDLLFISNEDKRKFVYPLKRAISTDDYILSMVEQLRGKQLVRWKASIIKILERISISRKNHGDKPIELDIAWGDELEVIPWSGFFAGEGNSGCKT